ncbi:MAG: cobalamin-independent methionine synthase II family protein [Chloroflexi bacterium]|nr:cobalamin-independent methionine synthase II family protein [Chloroflexota bacterium]MBV9600050.1 cobalamin-independent methionine synthase II family protein [Chloroflexota bacterium]
MYRADHVGSLLRPAALLEAREQFARGTLSESALREREDAAILAALERQKQVGLEVFTDGEFRRGSWITDMAEAVDGFVRQSRTIEWRGPGAGAEPSTSSVVGGRLKPRRRLTGEQTAFLKQHAPGRIKMTLPAPSNFWVVSWKAGVSDQVYASRHEMLADVVGIVRREIETLLADGVAYIQLDAPFYGVFIDEQHRATLRHTGVDPDQALHEVVAADNAAIAGLKREDVTFGLHICRGNSRSRWLYEGAYNPLAEALFGGLDVDTFLLEYDSPRDGDFSPLRHIPAGKTAVLGLVSSKEPGLESVDDLRRRIDEAARILPLEQLALSPQCGFASVALGNLVSESDQWRKLQRVVETARKVWG